MIQAIRQEAIVQQNNTIEIHSPILKPGVHVEVIILLEDEHTVQKKRLSTWLGAGKGSFAFPKEADAFIRGERDKWE